MDKIERLANDAFSELDLEACPDCGGTGEIGTAHDGRKISCELCGGHEDSLGRGWIWLSERDPVQIIAAAFRPMIKALQAENLDLMAQCDIREREGEAVRRESAVLKDLVKDHEKDREALIVQRDFYQKELEDLRKDHQFLRATMDGPDSGGGGNG